MNASIWSVYPALHCRIWPIRAIHCDVQWLTQGTKAFALQSQSKTCTKCSERISVNALHINTRIIAEALLHYMYDAPVDDSIVTDGLAVCVTLA